jgi:putative phosphoribosyl transferase
VAYEVARALDAELDLLFVRKLGAPGHEEFGIGAVVDGADPQVVLNEESARMAGAGPGYVKEELRRQLGEIDRRRQAYMGDRDPIPSAGRTVIVVDDGIATGGTVKAALRGVRKAGPAHLVLAVPVAPADTIADLHKECDELVCLRTPEVFYAVGAHYADFTQTEDDEVVTLLERSHRLTL